MQSVECKVQNAEPGGARCPSALDVLAITSQIVRINGFHFLPAARKWVVCLPTDYRMNRLGIVPAQGDKAAALQRQARWDSALHQPPQKAALGPRAEARATGHLAQSTDAG